MDKSWKHFCVDFSDKLSHKQTALTSRSRPRVIKNEVFVEITVAKRCKQKVEENVN